jgi:hypothetical protein
VLIRLFQRFVHDKIWVVEECLRLDVVTSLQLHEQIMSLAAIVSKSIENEKLRKRVLNAAQILAIIRLAVPRDEDACELYLRFRHSTILAFAFAMSEVIISKCLSIFCGFRRQILTC